MKNKFKTNSNNIVMFTKFIINYQDNLFDELSNVTSFEEIIKGRLGAVLVDCQTNLIPIVRTTSMYSCPVQLFSQIHYDIIKKIRDVTNMPQLKFNNALVEIYNSRYRTMGYHSDQSLDLDSDSYICIFSCYDNPNDIRKLQVKKKNSDELFEIQLEHNSCILFSVSTNSEYLHRIVLENNTSNNRWLGITFRFSKSFVEFIDKIPYLNQKELTVATDKEKKEFYEYRSNENKNISYIYPEINYTISRSDILAPLDNDFFIKK